MDCNSSWSFGVIHFPGLTILGPTSWVCSKGHIHLGSLGLPLPVCRELFLQSLFVLLF